VFVIPSLANLCPWPTRRADELTREEVRAGSGALGAKLERFKPSAVAYTGIGVYKWFRATWKVSWGMLGYAGERSRTRSRRRRGALAVWPQPDALRGAGRALPDPRAFRGAEVMIQAMIVPITLLLPWRSLMPGPVPTG
jgi:hypothetical protein